MAGVSSVLEKATLLIVFWQICDRECQALQVKLFIQSVGDECQVLSVSALGLRGTRCLYFCHNQSNFCFGNANNGVLLSARHVRAYFLFS